MQKESNERLLTFDALRGLAAITVIFYHLDFVVPIAPSGYLAVDFFFLMSGFVISRAYQQRLKTNLSPFGFFVERLIRLYPIYILGLSIGLLRRIAQIYANHPMQMQKFDLAISLVFNILAMPSPAVQEIAPINGPSWSLFFEILVNIIWAAFFINASTKKLGFSTALLGVALCLDIIYRGSAQFGFEWNSIEMGFLRSSFGFSLGLFIARLTKRKKAQPSIYSIFSAIALCVFLMLSVTPENRKTYDNIIIFLAFPAILLAAIRYNPPAIFDKLAIALGDISYPAYLLHFPALYTISFFSQKMGIIPNIWIPLFLVSVCSISFWISRTYDPAARSYLKNWLRKTEIR